MSISNLRSYLSNNSSIDKTTLTNEIMDILKKSGYHIVECNIAKPWGSYIRIANEDVEAFVHEFFIDLDLKEARLGVEDAELSPKILIVSPGHRLSWQYHNRRAERWIFLTKGTYYRSLNDREGQKQKAQIGTTLQFKKGERHRLGGVPNGFVVVAEIWQHSEIDNPSDEDDIIRISDDYKR